MSAIRPEFLQIRRVDIDRFGWLGAHILALIKYVQRLPDERNGRVCIDGEMWWQVSYADLAESIGNTTRNSVWRKVGELESAEVLRSCMPGCAKGTSKADTTKAYRVVRQRCDMSFHSGETASPVVSLQRDNPVSHRDDPVSAEGILPLLGELEEGGERRAAPSDRPDPTRTRLDPAIDPAQNPADNGKAGPDGHTPDGAALKPGEWPDWEPKPAWAIPPDPCPKGGNCQGNCHQCGDQRRWDHPNARADRRQANYDQAWRRYSDLERQARAGLYGEWRPERPKPLTSSGFDPDRPWYVAGPPAEAVA